MGIRLGLGRSVMMARVGVVGRSTSWTEEGRLGGWLDLEREGQREEREPR